MEPTNNVYNNIIYKKHFYVIHIAIYFLNDTALHICLNAFRFSLPQGHYSTCANPVALEGKGWFPKKGEIKSSEC